MHIGVGDKVRIISDEGEILGGTVIDFDNYPNGRVFLIQFSNGEEKEVPENELRNFSKKSKGRK